MGAFDRAHDAGRDAGIREAIVLVSREPNLPGPMPLWSRLLATIFPARSARAGGEAMRHSILTKLRALLEEETA